MAPRIGRLENGGIGSRPTTSGDDFFMFARIMVLVGGLAALGLAGAGVHGYAGFEGRDGLGRHILLGLAPLLLFVIAHAWSLFYLGGMARVLRETAAETGRPSAIGPVLARFGRRTVPPALAAILTALAVFVVGAAMQGRAADGRLHGPLLWVALALAAWATVAEWRTVLATEHALTELRRGPVLPRGERA
jgi:hypothetical protein